MLKGYRTYITLAVMVLNQILASTGFVDYGPGEVETAINVILAIIAFFFRMRATPPAPKPVTK